MAFYSSLTQWDSDADIVRVLGSIATNEAKGIVLHDDAMSTSYSDFSTKDGVHISMRDELERRERMMTLHEIRSMLHSGDCFIVGGRGEERFDAAQAARRPAHPFNAFRTKDAVLGTVRQISSARGDELDDRLFDVLADMPELELTELVMRYAQDPEFKIDQAVTVPAPTLN